MSRAHRRGVVWLSLVLLLLCLTPAKAGAVNACADGGRQRPDEGGIGGTGARPAAPDNGDSGIGGTGIGGAGARPASPDDDDSGIGGTGIANDAATGLIGTITGFASICVGDLEIHYDAQTPVRIDGQNATATDLAVGQVVEVLARGAGSERMAQEIDVHHIVSGPVDGMDPEGHGEAIIVVGQSVLVSGTVGVASAFAPGTVVQVSGMRRGDGVIVASQIERTDTGGLTRDLVQLTGPVAESRAGVLNVAGTEVQIADGRHVADGDEVRVVGRWDGEAIRAQSIESLARVPFEGRVARVEIEGYARESSDGQLHVGAFPIELHAAAATLRQPFESDARIRVEGQVRDRHVIVDRLEVMNGLPERPSRPDNDGHPPDNDGHPHKDGGFDDRGHGSDPPPFDQPKSGQPDGPPPREDGSMPPPRPEPRGVDAPDLHMRPDGANPPGFSRAEQPDRPAPPDVPRAERAERPDVPRPERPDRPDRPDVPRPERPPRPERVQRIDRPQRPGRP